MQSIYVGNSVMKPKKNMSLLLPLVFLLSWNALYMAAGDDDGRQKGFVQCLSNFTSLASNIVYPSDNPSFSRILDTSIRNKRFGTPTTPKPLVVVTPFDISHVQSVVVCARSHGLRLRIRSGGHDYDGLSYASPHPFVVLDMIHMSNVTVDVAKGTAWVQSGATVGQVYSQVGKSSKTLAFPASVCHTVGVGGHVSGGGYGTLLRYAGLAADHVTDVQVVDAEGQISAKDSLGDDVFWAIRGGGGNTFGVVVAWKFNLVTVPGIVTMFTVSKTLEQDPTKYIAKWQQVADKFPDELFIRVVIYKVTKPKTNLVVTFNALYVGDSDKTLPLLQQSFPELGVTKAMMVEMTWAESTIQFAGIENTSLDALEIRTPVTERKYFKAKSDYVTKPIPESGLEGLLNLMLQDDIEDPYAIFTPYGGKMAKIASNSIPFPHREGNLFQIQYLVYWEQDGEEASNRHMKWMRDVYDYMESYVSSNPRAAYVNYRDMEIGENSMNSNNETTTTTTTTSTSYQQAKVWGVKYFKGNFDRLVKIKTAYDPTNFFSNEQSIPSLDVGKQWHTTSKCGAAIWLFRNRNNTRSGASRVRYGPPSYYLVFLFLVLFV